ncbi:MAG: thioredoxin domain-containing protein [Patescibacteria group bacterium]|jgi:protein-disulfide isomerase
MDPITHQTTKRERREQRKVAWREERQSAVYQQKVRRIGLWAVVFVVVIGGVWLLSKTTSNNGKPGAVVPSVNEITADDWTTGNQSAAVTLVEYSDFQCPACGAYYPTVKKVTQDFSNTVRFVYRNYPLKSIHPNAESAAWAAGAAGRQGKFWEMHDLLFDRQKQWEGSLSTKGTFHDYAVELGLNGDQFDKDYDSSVVRDKVATDVASGNAARIAGTPSFFLNGVQISPAPNYTEFSTLINDQLNKKN